ncbi:hypothetical protein GGTG_04655 [Gaeumannomyces tritici R3-111a-1]|uniref:Uncharacterized protein n=1 Tax=Gaeumannomyces tritici (strain R3-111a-1) TaxID=644352 RepID=J3NTQ5_GAET3|nr:hypothetical protein GGTG_04655 [Gaeumannomyces tritici R3-111a-1]EJT79570.1 hypothetical protein GGTG_04655 [Gaeumannomyces tritici R3-111a-1]
MASQGGANLSWHELGLRSLNLPLTTDLVISIVCSAKLTPSDLEYLGIERVSLSGSCIWSITRPFEFYVDCLVRCVARTRESTEAHYQQAFLESLRSGLFRIRAAVSEYARGLPDDELDEHGRDQTLQELHAALTSEILRLRPLPPPDETDEVTDMLAAWTPFDETGELAQLIANLELMANGRASDPEA